MKDGDYQKFLNAKSQVDTYGGFEPLWMPDFLFDFQKALVDWNLRKGKAADFADCGLGKTVIELVWADNIFRKKKKPVLIATPLAVSYQTIREAEKFGIECVRSTNGKVAGDITVTNYERLHLFNPDDWAGLVADESSILKNYDGVTRALITEFMRTLPYRLLCTATASPNDYPELGTASEALGELGYMDMLTRFFKNQQETIATNRYHGALAKWRFKKHAEVPFWRWVCSWARALRRPSDLGFDDGDFILPKLIERQTIVNAEKLLPGELFPKIAVGLKEQRDERRLTLRERCEKAAELVDHKRHAVIWCDLNDEGDLLENIIPDAVQVSGSDSDDEKEEKLLAFSAGQIKDLITKSKITGFGMNWQHCNHAVCFADHSFERYYQLVRRFWRFGQKNPVTVDTITTPGGMDILKNRQRKAEAADKMFSSLVAHMNDVLQLKRSNQFSIDEEIPVWL